MDMNWRAELMEKMADNGETLKDLIHITISDEELDRNFDGGYGGREGADFTAWTLNHVYFNDDYDGADFIHSVRRHPPGLLDEVVEEAVLHDKQ